MSKTEPEFKVKDMAIHPKYGLVEIYEIYENWVNVFPADEDKHGPAARVVNLSDLKKP